jgi:hypothetical protein
MTPKAWLLLMAMLLVSALCGALHTEATDNTARYLVMQNQLVFSYTDTQPYTILRPMCWTPLSMERITTLTSRNIIGLNAEKPMFPSHDPVRQNRLSGSIQSLGDLELLEAMKTETEAAERDKKDSRVALGIAIVVFVAGVIGIIGLILLAFISPIA